MKNKYVAILIVFQVLVACTDNKKTTATSDAKDTLHANLGTADTGADSAPQNELVNRINEIKKVPYRTVKFDSSEIDEVSWSCGDSLFWQIVKLGKDAIPILINKVGDSTKTGIRVPCRNRNLTIGSVAFMALDKIVSIPAYLVFKIQWDVIKINCDFGYADGFLDYISERPVETRDKLAEWYRAYVKSMQLDSLKATEQTECESAYGIKHRIYVDY